MSKKKYVIGDDGTHEKKISFDKKRLYEIVEASHNKDIASHLYDMLILICVIVGLYPLAVKTESTATRIIDLVTACVFLLDYIARVYTADYKMGIKSYKSYMFYAFSPMAIIDLLSIVPILALVFPVSNTIALFRLFRVFRLLKLARYSKSLVVIEQVIRKVKKQLMAVLGLVLAYILAVSLIIFQVEPDIFDTIFDAIYWSAISITTIGYGDITPTSDFGRIVTVLSALMGVAVIALPTGIITAAYTDEIKRVKGKHEL